MLRISLGDGLFEIRLVWHNNCSAWSKTYTEILDLVKNLIVESEVIAGNDIDTSLLLNVPVLETKSLCLSKKLSLRELSSPVSFCCLLQITVDSHARETEDSSETPKVSMV